MLIVTIRAAARRLRLSAALAAMALPIAMAGAQTQPQPYPSRPIKFIVDGPAGGINDIWARRYAQRISESIGQSVVIDNRPGASGSIAAEALAKAAPDGYTMFYGGMNPLVAYPMSGGVVRYDPTRDFAAVALGTMGYPVLVVNPALGVKSVADLVNRAKAGPDELLCGTAGHASVQHLSCALFARAAGIRLRYVPYKGGSAALTDLAGGQVQIAVGYTAELEPFTGPGKVSTLAAYAPARLPRFPDAPTFAEAGYAGVTMPSFAGIFMPAGTPADIIARMNAEAIKAMARPEMGEFVRSAGGFYSPMKPAELAEMLRGEQQKWKKLSDETGIRIE